MNSWPSTAGHQPCVSTMALSSPPNDVVASQAVEPLVLRDMEMLRARSAAFAGKSQPTRIVTAPVMTTQPGSPAVTSIFPRIVETSRDNGSFTANDCSKGSRCATAGVAAPIPPANTRANAADVFISKLL